jgi:peptidoglycan/LPS O-acetylase OafA/YrhL
MKQAAVGLEQSRNEWPLFDYIRLVAASSVILSHAFLIAEGTEQNEPFVRLLGAHNNLGLYGVFVFFVISGFLVTNSAEKTPSTMRFLWHRVMRIYPALIVCLLLTGIVLGAMFSNLALEEYFRLLYPWKYAAKGTLYLEAWSIPTVSFYAEGDWIGEGVNGSLWTIRYEVACYLLLAVLLSVRRLRLWEVLSIFLVVQTLLLSGWGKGWPDPIPDAILVLPSFFAGSLVAIASRGHRLPRWPLLPCGALLLIAISTGKVMEFFPLFGGYPLLWFAILPAPRAPRLRKVGDISYGMYLYGWPIEQMYKALMGPAEWWEIFFPSILTAALCGYASWHLIERRALKAKDFKWRGISEAVWERERNEGWTIGSAVIPEGCDTCSGASNVEPDRPRAA